MKVVITGGCGFIGINLAKWFMKNEPDTEVVLLDIVTPEIDITHSNVSYVYGDIRNLNCLINVFEGAEEVYHLAGILGTSELIDIASLATEVNITGATNVLDACKICGVDKVYNVAKPHFDGYAENAYTLTKHAGELMGKMYQEKYGMNVATVRWLNAVGPHQHIYPVRKFLPMMILQAMFGKPLEVYGSGNQTIDPIDTRDMARLTVYACRNLGQNKEVVDLGSGNAITCNDACETILRVCKEEGIFSAEESYVKHIPMRPGEADDINLCADMSYWDEQGITTEFTFEDSVRATVRYMMEMPMEHLQNAMKFYNQEVDV
jgi:UDP-glucose 4-epimerase